MQITFKYTWTSSEEEILIAINALKALAEYRAANERASRAFVENTQQASVAQKFIEDLNAAYEREGMKEAASSAEDVAAGVEKLSAIQPQVSTTPVMQKYFEEEKRAEALNNLAETEASHIDADAKPEARRRGRPPKAKPVEASSESQDNVAIDGVNAPDDSQEKLYNKEDLNVLIGRVSKCEDKTIKDYMNTWAVS